MRKIKKHKIAGMSFLSMLALLFTFALLAGSRVCAQEIRSDIEIPVTQKFILENVHNTSVNQKAVYELTALQTDVPMPEGSVEGKFTFSLEGDGQIKIAMSYGHGGVYPYELRQTTPDAERYKYDSKVYTVTVYVRNGENGELIPQLVVQNEQKEKCEEILFRNTYTGEKLPVHSGQPEEIKPKEPSDQVKTGDSASVSAWLTMLILALFGLTGIELLKKKRNHIVRKPLHGL